MAKQLKLYNGRGWACVKRSDPKWNGVSPDKVSISAAAYSRADLRRLIEEYTGADPGLAELRDYWVECWGDDMAGITPERGLWMSVGWSASDKTTKLFPVRALDSCPSPTERSETTLRVAYGLNIRFPARWGWEVTGSMGRGSGTADSEQQALRDSIDYLRSSTHLPSE